MRTLFVSSVSVMLVAVLLVIGSASSARAATCGEVPQVLIVLDRSGSMDDDAGGKKKWIAATDAVTALVGQFAGQLALGVMLFPQWPSIDGCTEGQVNVAPGLASGPSISNVLAKAAPEGKTPIASSLDAARSYFTSQPGKPRYVILITDGMETCRVPNATTESGSCIPLLEGGRKCGECGVQFCNLIGAKWTSCDPDPGAFPCLKGATCQSDATCSAGGTGSTNPTQAGVSLSAEGIATYVVGFGSEVDASSLNAVASAGGTGAYHQADNLTQLSATLSQIAAAISCCGNGALDGGEKCDTAIVTGQPGACPAGCDDGDACTVDTLFGEACQASCENTPITAAANGDGCCPPGATPQSDTDCVEPCGNGVLDNAEKCDVQIVAGQPGACPASCNDNDPCTTDELTGSDCQLSCAHKDVGPSDDETDWCCPEGYTKSDDIDCLPACNPDQTTNCIDLCKDVSCPQGKRCEKGKCVPVPDAGSAGSLDGSTGGAGPGGSPDSGPGGPGSTSTGENFDSGGGCSCRAGGGGSGDGSSGATLVALALLALFLRPRRRRREHIAH